MWLKKNDIYDQVCSEVEAAGRDFRKELSDLYVSPVIAKALLKTDPTFAISEQEAKKAFVNSFLIKGYQHRGICAGHARCSGPRRNRTLHDGDS